MWQVDGSDTMKSGPSHVKLKRKRRAVYTGSTLSGGDDDDDDEEDNDAASVFEVIRCPC